MPNCHQNGCRRGRQTASATGNVNSTVNESTLSTSANATTTSTSNGTFIEDMPMCHYVNPIPLCNGGSGGDLETEILAALQCQNQLLVDILGAINALTAATLGGRGCH